MKVVNLETFIKLPSGTVFSFYESNVFNGLMIKHTTISGINDFLYLNLIGNINAFDSDEFFDKCKKLEHGDNCSLDFETLDRDGLFEKDQLFAVYDKADVLGLMRELHASTLEPFNV